jgi:hypothetical protein
MKIDEIYTHIYINMSQSLTTKFETIACKTKILEYENFLTGKTQQDIDGSTFLGSAKNPIAKPTDFKIIERLARSLKEGGMQILSIKEKGNNKHSVILFKSQFLPDPGFAIFDPNGLAIDRGKPSFPLEINIDGQNITSQLVDTLSVATLNYGTAGANPGFCGIFGIIFMMYFKAVNTQENWVQNWQAFVRCLSQTGLGVSLAQQVFEILNKFTNLPGISASLGNKLVNTNPFTSEVYATIVQYLHQCGIPLPELATGGKSKRFSIKRKGKALRKIRRRRFTIKKRRRKT